MKRKFIATALAMVLAAGTILASNVTALADTSYTVKKGDSLWKIAKEYLGNGALYPQIYEANRSIIKNPNFIQVGWQIVIPGTETVSEEEVIKTYEGEGGWKLSYNTDKYFLNDMLGDGETGFNYIGECSGTTAIIVSYHPDKMPDEVLYEKVEGYDDSLVSRGETMFAGYWSHFRHINPPHEDPNQGDVMYESFTAIEHNGGTVLIESISHLETDEAQYNEIIQATTELLNTFELINHQPQTEYAYYPGTYVREYTDEIEGDTINITDTVELREDHSASVTFQDTVEGVWTGTKIIFNDGTENELNIEGTTLYLNMDGEWTAFEKK